MKYRTLLWLGLFGSMVCAANHLYVTHNYAAALPWALVVIFQLKDIFNYDCNLNTNNLDNILEFFDKKIKDKWSDTFEGGKCIKCSMTCGASSQIDHSRLYNDIKI